MLRYSPPRYLLRRHTILNIVKPAESFLEVGAGGLRLSVELLRHFDTGTCIDFAPELKKLHRALPAETRKRLTPIVGDMFALNATKKYDCVVSCEVMEHVEDDFAFLERIHKLTRPGGQIIISVPAHQKYWTVHDDVAGHIRRYDRKRLKKLFDNKRFSDVEVISYGFPFINILWLFRRMHGKSQQKQKQTWSKEKQTKNSGVGGLSSIFQLLAIISNKYVFYIPNLIASLFNKHDWSEGYIITATKK